MLLKDLIKLNYQGDVVYLDIEKSHHPYDRRLHSSLPKLNKEKLNAILNQHNRISRNGSQVICCSIESAKICYESADLCHMFYKSLIQNKLRLLYSSDEIRKKGKHLDERQKMLQRIDACPDIKLYSYKVSGVKSFEYFYAFLSDKPGNDDFISNYIAELKKKHPRKYKNLKYKKIFEGEIK